MFGSLRKLVRKAAARLASRPPARFSSPDEVGVWGERVAARHLKRAGYMILERNFETVQGEIDLIAFRDGVLTFVEVRSQTAGEFGGPLSTITRPKQLRVIKAAEQYAALHGLEAEDVELRFDVVSVVFGDGSARPQVEHVEGAFGKSARLF